MTHASAPTIPRLEIANASLERGGRLLFTRLSFSIGGGEALLVTGPNGAGKSSLLRAIAGFLPLGSGRISFHDGGEEAMPAGLRAHYVGHADALKSALTAVENLVFWAAMLGPAARLRAVEALDRLALSHVADLPVAYLSAGQRRRVALARLIMAERPLWLLDEPATALDAASQDRLAEIMQHHIAQGGMLIAATHAPLGLTGTRELRLGRPA